VQGKRSCHTGYRRTVGWTLPVGFLTQTGVVRLSEMFTQIMRFQALRSCLRVLACCSPVPCLRCTLTTRQAVSPARQTV
jgi:hypothetical protein